MTDDRLIAALRDLGTATWLPEAPDVAAALADVPAPSRRPRYRWAVAAAVAALVVLAIVITPVRQAVADWLGIGAVRIVEVDEVPVVSDEVLTGLGDELDLDTSALIGSFDIAPDALGSADRLFINDLGAGRLWAISAVWFPRDGLPEVGNSGVGALLTLFEGTLDRPVVEKSVGDDATVEIVQVGDVVGYWITGDAHIFAYLDPDGETIEESIRLAGNTLLWEIDGVSFRFESALDLAAAVAVAASLDN